MLRKTSKIVVAVSLTFTLLGCNTASPGNTKTSASNTPEVSAKTEEPEATPPAAETNIAANSSSEWTPVQKGPYTFYKECPDCHGEGITCDRCNGTGEDRQYIGNIMGGDGTIAFPCPSCVRGVKQCSTCNAKHYELHPEAFLSEEERQAYIARLYHEHEDAEASYAQKMEHIRRDEAQLRLYEARRRANMGN